VHFIFYFSTYLTPTFKITSVVDFKNRFGFFFCFLAHKKYVRY
jgi:hypothetical protein